MADKQLSALTAGGAVADADLFYSSQSGNSRKVTGAQLKTYAQTGISGGASIGLIRMVAAGQIIR